MSVERFRMLDIDGVLYRPEDALRLGLVGADDLEPTPAEAPREVVPDHIITSATAGEAAHVGPDTEPDPAGTARVADSTPAPGKRVRSRK